MAWKIEPGLIEKFARYAAAARGGDMATLTTLSRGGGSSSISLDREQISFVDRIVGARFDSPAKVREVMGLAAGYLPESIFNTVVFAAPKISALPALRDRLAELGIDMQRQNGSNYYLERIGMMCVQLPPLPGILEWLQAMPGNVLVSDGDRRLSSDEPLQERMTEPVGPMESVANLMMQGQALGFEMSALEGRATVAVIDTDIDIENPALAGRVINRFLIGSDTFLPDHVGHGTHVAGIIAGLPLKDGSKLSGVAPFCHLLEMNTYHPLGSSSFALLKGIDCAIGNGADVINISMGLTAPADGNSAESRALEIASQKGIIACVSAGNSGSAGHGTITPPGDAPSAITVAACTGKGLWAPFSSMGPTAAPPVTGAKPNIAAPGLQIISLRSKYSSQPPWQGSQHYTVMSGTSMAAPIISGICALGVAVLRSEGRKIPPPALVRQALQESAFLVQNDEGGHKLGAGVPRLPRFISRLRELSEPAGKVAPTPQRPAPPRQDDEAMRERPAPSQPVPAEPPVAERPQKPLRRLAELVREMRDLEEAFIEGVTTNLEQNKELLAQEMVGAEGVTIKVLKDESEVRRVADQAAGAGIDRLVAEALPANREYGLEFASKGFFGGSSPLFHVYVKSFSGWDALRLLTEGEVALEVATVRKYMAARRREADKLPCVFVLLAPNGWTDSLSGVALSGGDKEVMLCQPVTEFVDDQPWFDVKASDYNWGSWLALTPMSFDRRREACLKVLLAHPELEVRGGTVAISELLPLFNLPRPVAEELLEESCNRDSRFDFFKVKDEKNKQGVNHITRIDISE